MTTIGLTIASLLMLAGWALILLGSHPMAIVALIGAIVTLGITLWGGRK